MEKNLDNAGARQLDAPVDGGETIDLLHASKVRGTAVYDDSGSRIGSIDDLALTKSSGEVAYAVMRFGGFLGVGEKYHTLPWRALHYDSDLGGYRVATADENFRDAPSFSRAELAGGDWRQATDRYYAAAPAATPVGDDGPGRAMETGPSGTIRLRDGSRDDSLEDDGKAETIDAVPIPR